MTPPVEGSCTLGLSGRCKVQPLWILAQDMIDEASLVTVKDSKRGMARKRGASCSSIYNADLQYFKAVPQLRRLVAGFPPRRPGLEPRSGHVGFVVDEVALGQVFPSTSVSPANFHSTDCSILTIYHPGMVQ
jgi:hypothetical protein